MVTFAWSASTILRGLITAVSVGAVASTTGCAVRMANAHAVQGLEPDIRTDEPVSGGEVLHVRLRLRAPTDGLSLSAVAGEVRDIWRPYLNVVIRAEQSGAAFTDELDVLIGEVEAGPARGLGWIPFVDGQPTRRIAVSLPRARQLLQNAHFIGRPLPEWPGMFERFLAQAIGRVIAHEIGHYVLRSSSHQSAGLMQAGLKAADVMRSRGNRFRLTHAEEVALRAASIAPSVDRSAENRADTGRPWRP